MSQGYLSFHANIFGWETQTSLRLRDITSITKEKTALVIPNAIQVVVDGGEKLFFTSFVTRDATYMMLFKLWQNALLEDVRHCFIIAPTNIQLELFTFGHRLNF